MDERKLRERIAIDPQIFGGQADRPRRRIAVEYVLGMLAAGAKVQRATARWDEALAEKMRRAPLRWRKRRLPAASLV